MSDRIIEIAVGIAVLLIVVAILFMAFLGESGPSCEERGGQRVQNGVLPQMSGKVTVMIPQYKCMKDGRVLE